MRRKFAMTFSISGIIIILAMFTSIVGCIEHQTEINNDVHVISAFAG